MDNVVEFDSETPTLDEIQNTVNRFEVSSRGYVAATPEDVAARISANNQVMLKSLESGKGCDSLRLHKNRKVEVMFRVASKSGDGQSRYINLGLHKRTDAIKCYREEAKVLIEAVDKAVQAGQFKSQCQAWIEAQSAKFQKETTVSEGGETKTA